MPAKKVKTKKKAAPKKKAAVKKAAPKKKAAVKRKAAPKKKAAVKKKAAPKKKAAVKKKAAPKKKTAAKKAAPKKKAAVKKKAAPKAPPAEKKPSKAELKEQKAQAEREKKKQKRIELLNKRSPVELPVEGITPYTLHRGESYMSDAQLEHFRNILLCWKQELIDEVKRTVDQMKNDASQFADPADRATQEEEFSLELRTRDRESKLIRKINQTLSTIDSEDYGYCESCGIEIGIKRLEARPTATLCIDCKTLQEIKEKQIFT
ncbi:MAG: RNA polymerase-binding protein DksA [Gammaproteobacteria bacterium]|nr:MAG: RNA polymerase-binding protein DksA [Gammaproteobacteria bacterium]